MTIKITVTVPSLEILKRNVYSIPQKLTDKEVIRKYGQLKAAQNAWVNGKLPACFYELSMYGRVPKDAATLSQISSAIQEYQIEIEKRHLFEFFELTVCNMSGDTSKK